jgi:hypothetical protein
MARRRELWALKVVTGFIEQNYPGIFSPDWIYGGKKHGWSLRYKKSKSFCTLIPERSRLVVQVVFGRDEREKAECILPGLTPGTREEYESAATYHDGKWLALVVDGDAALKDLKLLLSVKRRVRAAM